MLYEELWETAYAIGYHAGRKPETRETDRRALQTLIRKYPEWAYMLGFRFDQGLAEAS